MITPAEAERLDREASDPIEVLMDRAARAVALATVKMGAAYGSEVAILVGPGNNGGDGYVASRYLRRRGVGVRLYALAEPKTKAAASARKSATSAGVPLAPLSEVEEADVIVDALFGGGFRHGMPAEIKPWLEHPAPVLAVDVPSGLDPATGEVRGEAFTARRTITFHAHKTGHFLGQGPDRCGDIEVADLGLGQAIPAFWLTEATDAPLPDRHRTVHKWSAGSVLVAGGAPGMVGAALLAARSALHFGAGAVGVAVPAESAEIAMAAAPELLHYTFADFPERYQVLVIGPGLGSHREELVRRLLAEWRGPVVVDADALGAIDPTRTVRTSPLVLTPHAGEFRKLTGTEPGPDTAAELAATTGAVVLLKGSPTWVTDGSTPWAVTTGGPELATIGTGDVLAGMIAALLAAGQPAAVAARTGAFWHGRAGAALAVSQTVTAQGLATFVGRLR
ncbi:MAG TPA: NAD(P)H-hydrate dehydratase [Acidimicrobiia bacterium]|nr:NAD(P)H-hydrate dehydratase [Acidimicrobiia bacterium]